jgi:2,4-dienoyl-CoA reductase-like NADH-dependent reductase (Old Yellow Enzyme family)
VYQPFPGKSETVVHFARKYAPETIIMGNGNLHVDQQALASLEDGADIVSLGKAALANPDLPVSLASGSPLKAFDVTMLLPIANIKDQELS